MTSLLLNVSLTAAGDVLRDVVYIFCVLDSVDFLKENLFEIRLLLSVGSLISL